MNETDFTHVGKMLETVPWNYDSNLGHFLLKEGVKQLLIKVFTTMDEEIGIQIKDHERGMELCKTVNNLTMAVSHHGSIKSLSDIQYLLKKFKNQIN